MLGQTKTRTPSAMYCITQSCRTPAQHGKPLCKQCRRKLGPKRYVTLCAQHNLWMMGKIDASLWIWIKTCASARIQGYDYHVPKPA
jgi:hypothetical protein